MKRALPAAAMAVAMMLGSVVGAVDAAEYCPAMDTLAMRNADRRRPWSGEIAIALSLVPLAIAAAAAYGAGHTPSGLRDGLLAVAFGS
jgi:hypothetical protein